MNRWPRVHSYSQPTKIFKIKTWPSNSCGGCCFFLLRDFSYVAAHDAVVDVTRTCTRTSQGSKKLAWDRKPLCACSGKPVLWLYTELGPIQTSDQLGNIGNSPVGLYRCTYRYMDGKYIWSIYGCIYRCTIPGKYSVVDGCRNTFLSTFACVDATLMTISFSDSSSLA